MQSRIIFALLTLAVAFTPGCSNRKSEPRSARMGENLPVGSLIYNVVDAQWKEHLGDSAVDRIPSNRYLLVRVSITNSGGSETIIPAMSLVDAGGAMHNEITDGSDVPQWLGMIRRIKPAQTEQGVVLFDVPVSSYSLQVSYEGDDPESELNGKIEIPLRLETEPPPTADKAVPVR